jgi:hypothetical protein
MKQVEPFLNLNLGLNLPEGGLLTSLLKQPDAAGCGLRLWPRFSQESGRDGAQSKATQEGETENSEGKAWRVPLSLADMPPGLSAHRCFPAHPNG